MAPNLGSGRKSLNCESDGPRNDEKFRWTRTHPLFGLKWLPLDQIAESMGTVAEGIPTTRSAVHLGERLDVETPIIREIHSILYESIPPAEAMQRLLT
jgi:glycerol-3-phosphate dehydrogenase